jgi:serine protease AprX
MNRVRRLVHADEIKEFGLTGKGITAAILDSGLSLHPDLRKRVIGFRDFLHEKTDCYDDYGHGTHVAGILGGNGTLSEGKYSGLAPGCSLLPVKILDGKGNGN